jgi:diacylglycerol kinase
VNSGIELDFAILAESAKSEAARSASDRASRVVIVLAVLLVVLTAAILWLTYELARHPGAGWRRRLRSPLVIT